MLLYEESYKIFSTTINSLLSYLMNYFSTHSKYLFYPKERIKIVLNFRKYEIFIQFINLINNINKIKIFDILNLWVLFFVEKYLLMM